MKKRGEDLSRHLTQAFDYWVRAVPNKPQYVVLCNFDEFRVYDFNEDINQPQDTLRLEELPERSGPLDFLCPTGERARFRIDREDATRRAAATLSAIYQSLRGKHPGGAESAQRFVLQALVCFFSEDALDAAVLDAYGFSARKDVLRQLLDLNLAVAKVIEEGGEATAPGVPATYGDSADIITPDCIGP